MRTGLCRLAPEQVPSGPGSPKLVRGLSNKKDFSRQKVADILGGEGICKPLGKGADAMRKGVWKSCFDFVFVFKDVRCRDEGKGGGVALKMALL